ncbi:hypothetical protein L195_g025390 [Trifolium pratense]|uniref:Uncharacterized protein n=1 Tax=Trifolium pratense TaxID=57577 RepID=A0A2K3NGC4_TRIPR|nr:hypothetical protein L195_g020612 [Trifolium pratense]PNY02086.1 hypothetical protein L195_g025390 [Trifolium pratense]
MYQLPASITSFEIGENPNPNPINSVFPVKAGRIWADTRWYGFYCNAYLMLLAGDTICADLSKNSVQLWFSEYFDDLELVHTYA